MSFGGLPTTMDDIFCGEELNAPVLVLEGTGGGHSRHAWHIHAT